MDVITISEKIQSKIAELEEARGHIMDNAQGKAQSISEYDRALALAIVKLRNNQITQFEGVPCTNLPATLIIPIAKGIVFQESFDKEANEAAYKGCLSIIEAIKAELNGLQSINKHLE